MNIQSFINGSFVSNSSNTFIKKNPYTGQELHVVESADLLQVVTAIQLSQKFFQEWKLSSIEDRIKVINSIAEVIDKNKIQFAKYEGLDQGLSFYFVLKNSIESILTTAKNVIEQFGNININFQYSPVGVVTIISSWNLSLRIILERALAAIAAGNTIVIKVSSESPVTVLILAQIIQQAQIPTGLIQVIFSNDQEVKKILLTHPAVKAISFIGQLQNASEVLKTVNANSLQQFKKIQISSGTKNTAAAITEPSDEVFEKVLSTFLIGQGQLAWNSARLFILEKNEKQWVEKIKEFLLNLRPSESIEDTSMWTPCIKESSFKIFSDLNKQAVDDQARLIQSTFNLSDSQKSCFLPVTFTQDMSNCSTLQQDQVFSPLFILSTVKYPFDIQKYSNVSYFGFAAHLYGDEDKITKLAESLDVSLVCKNKWSVEIAGARQGVKQSGYGLQDCHVFGDFFSNVKELT